MKGKDFLGREVLIDECGLYRTRDGRRVRIEKVGKSDPGTTAFRCKGYLEVMFRGKMRFKEWCIWHESGQYSGMPEHRRNIVAKIEGKSHETL